jgi:hypothetical protein
LTLDEADAIILGDENAMTDNSNHIREKFFQVLAIHRLLLLFFQAWFLHEIYSLGMDLN